MKTFKVYCENHQARALVTSLRDSLRNYLSGATSSSLPSPEGQKIIDQLIAQLKSFVPNIGGLHDAWDQIKNLVYKASNNQQRDFQGNPTNVLSRPDKLAFNDAIAPYFNSFNTILNSIESRMG